MKSGFEFNFVCLSISPPLPPLELAHFTQFIKGDSYYAENLVNGTFFEPNVFLKSVY